MLPEHYVGQRYWVGLFAIAAGLLVFFAASHNSEVEAPVKQFLSNQHWTRVKILDTGDATGLEGCDSRRDVKHYYVSGVNQYGKQFEDTLVCCDDNLACEIRKKP